MPRGGERLMVPPVKFRSYYGRRVVRPPVWKHDIAAYLFTGGLAAGSSLVAAGADLRGAPALRRSARTTALGALVASTYFLISDLGRPERALNMLRVAKITSPMSVGSWILAAYGPFAGAAAVGEYVRPLRWTARPAGLAAAGVAPAVASYTAVLLAHTSVPTWREAHRELPFVFVGSASAASGGMGLLLAPVSETSGARRFAVAGAVLELAAEHRMERSVGLAAETLHHGRAGAYMRAAKALTAGGAALAVVGRRSRVASAIAGVALLAGSACTRFGVFEAGIHSAEDPKYTVVPQRQRLESQSGEHKDY